MGYITVEERAKELQSLETEHVDILKYYGDSLTHVIKEQAKSTKLKDIFYYFDEHYDDFDQYNIFRLREKPKTISKNPNNQNTSEEINNAIKTIEDIKDALINQTTVEISDNHTLDNCPLEVIGDLLLKIAIKQNLLKIYKKSLELKQSKNDDAIKLQSTKIQKVNSIYINNTKVANIINQLPLNNKNVRANVTIDKQKKTLTTLNISNINYTNNSNSLINFKANNNINYFDSFVHDTVCTYWETGQDIITPTMILRAMRGNPKKTNFSKQQIETVRKSLDKMRLTSINLDISGEAKLKQWNNQDNQIIIKGYLLPLTGITVITGGNKIDGYKLLDEPPLWQYAKKTNQRLTVSSDLIRPLSFDKYGLIYYLIKRLYLIKYGKETKHSNIIDLEKMFNKLGLGEEYKNKTQKKRILNNMTEILDTWAQKKHIKKYEVIIEGKTNSKIKIYA